MGLWEELEAFHGRCRRLPWKVQAALGKKRILLPSSMREDFESIPIEERYGIIAVYAENFREVFKIIFGDAITENK
ncbi:unnamed protein product [Meloidogyne enterolobii]|uniref:Uncharacterized protein n=1 Tax=Meloidogyne enterolobii TaxID=390850 RepID=A0ACB1A8W2_MELEN